MRDEFEVDEREWARRCSIGPTERLGPRVLSTRGPDVDDAALMERSGRRRPICS